MPHKLMSASFDCEITRLSAVTHHGVKKERQRTAIYVEHLSTGRWAVESTFLKIFKLSAAI